MSFRTKTHRILLRPITMLRFSIFLLLALPFLQPAFSAELQINTDEYASDLGIISTDNIVFTSSGIYLNMNQYAQADSLKIQSGNSNTITGGLNGDPAYGFVVNSTTLESGSTLIIENPNTNNLGNMTAANSSTFKTFTNPFFLNAGETTITTIDLNDTATNGFTFNQHSSATPIIITDLKVSGGDGSTSKDGKIIFETGDNDYYNLAISKTTVGTGTTGGESEAAAAHNSLTVSLRSSTTISEFSLGAISLGNGTLILDDSIDSSSMTIKGSSLTLTGTSMLNGDDNGIIHKLSIGDSTLTDNGKYLYYNSERIELVGSDGSTAITSAYLIDTAAADPKITNTTNITADKEYQGIELATDAAATVTVSNNSTAGIVGSTILNNNTLTIETGSTFNQLNDNTTNKADFTGENGTVNLGGTLTLSNTNTTSGANKIGTLNTTSASAQITGNPLEVTDINIENAEELTLKNTTTISTTGTVSNAGTLTLDGATLNISSTNQNLGAISSEAAASTLNVTAGTTNIANSAANQLDVNVSADATFSIAATASTINRVTLKGSGSSNTGTMNISTGTLTSMYIVADDHGTLSVAKDASLNVLMNTTIGTGTVDNKANIADNTLTVSADHTSSGSVNLGAILMGNGTLTIDDSNGTAAATTISGTTLTLTGASMLNGNDAGIVHVLKLTGDTFTPDGHNLYYNSSRVSLVDNSSSAITSANLIDTAEAADKITTTTNISSSEEYKGIELTSGSSSTVTISNNSTAGIVGDTTLNNNTLTIESGSTFNQLNDNDTNKADFNAGNATVNLGGTLTLANTNTTSGSNKLDTLNTTGSSAEITGTGKELTLRELDIDTGEGLTVKNIITFQTNGTVSNSGTLTLDGGTINSSAGSLNLGTVASGTGNGKINVNAGTTTATATTATKTNVDIATAATFKTAATSSLDTVTLKGSASSNTAHLDIAAGTTTLKELIADGHGIVNVTKNASLDVTTGTTVGTGTASEQASAKNNTLTIQADNTSTGTVDLGAVTLGNGTLTLDDTNNTAGVLTVSADSLTLTGTSMLNGNDAGVIHMLKLGNDTLTDAGNYLYYNSERVKLVQSDGTTAVTNSNLKDTYTASSAITTTTTLDSDGIYTGIALTDLNNILINNNSTIGIAGNTTLSDSAYLTIDEGSTLNQLNDNSTNTGDFETNSNTSIIQLGGTLNFANTNSTGKTNSIGTLIILGSKSTLDGGYVNINNLLFPDMNSDETLTIKNKVSTPSFYSVGSIQLDGGELTINSGSRSSSLMKLIAKNTDNKLTINTPARFTNIEVTNGDLSIYSNNNGYAPTFKETTITADTTNSTLTSYAQTVDTAYESVIFNGTYDDKDTTSTADDTGYHATLDISDITNKESTATKVTVNEGKTGQILTNQTQEVTIDTVEIKSNSTLYLPRNSTTALNINNLYTSGTLNITSSTNTVKSLINVNNISVQAPFQIVADGDGSGGKDALKLTNYSLSDPYIYDSSKLEFLDSSGTTIDTSTSSSFIDTYNAVSKTAAANEQVDISSNTAMNNLDISASGSSGTVDAGITVATTGTTTLGSNNLNLNAGANLVAQGNIDGGSGTVNLGNGSTLTTTGTNNTVGTLTVTGDSATLAGGTTKVTNLNVASGKIINVGGSLDITNATSTQNVYGKMVVHADNTGLNIGNSALNLADFSADSNSYLPSFAVALTISGNSQAASTVSMHSDTILDIHTNLSNVTLNATAATYDSDVGAFVNNGDGTYKVACRRFTLNMTDSTLIIGNRNYITGVDDDVNDSHIEVLGAAAGNTSTIDNRSVLDINQLYLLNVTSGSTAGYTTMLDIDNTETTNSIFNITTTNVTGDATGGAATLNFKATGGTNTVIQDINLTTLNINGVDATGTATVTNQHHTDLSVDTVNFLGTTGVFDNQVAYASTAATTAKLGAVNLGTTTGNAVTATLKSTVSDAKTTITTATVTGGTSAGTLNITGDDANDTFDITTLNLAGADAVTDAVLTINNNSTVSIANTSLVSGTFGTINNNTNTTFKDGTLDGELKIAGSTLNLDNGTFTIGSTGKLDVSANNMTVDNSDKLIFNLGTTSDSTDNVVDTAGKYATVTGNITATRTGTTIENVYGIAGISGETYLDVVTFAGGVSAAVDDTLQTDDYLRTYTLKDQDAQADAFDILVETNSSGISTTISSAGGSTQDATDIEELVNKQATADSAGQSYITQVFNMSPTAQVTAMEEKRGEDATTATTQASIQTISASSGAVSNQLTAFRSGNLAAGMSSSFGSSGSTAALSDMADAETLEDAYSSVGYTAASTDSLRKYQVWANGFGGFGEQGSTDDSRGYDFHNIGTMVGIDYRLAEELRLGGLLGYSYNVTEIYNKSGKSKDNALRVGSYASFNWNSLFIDLSPTLGIHFIEAQRNLNTGTVATGKRTALDFNINSTIGYTFTLQNDLMLTPSFSLGYTMFHDPDYTETGAGAQNNSFDSFTSNSLLQDLGIKAGKLFRHNERLAFLPEAWAGWEVEYLNTGGDRNSTTSASLFSNTYTTSMNGMATHRGYWGAGLTALINENVSIFGRYDHKLWDKGYNVGFSAGIKVTF